MEEHQRDLASLIKFYTFAKTNGYINPGTADNRIAAVKAIFNTVKNVDTSDITKLDIDSIFKRYTILVANKVPVATLRGYAAHLRGAIREFDTYLTDPMNYKPVVIRTRKDRPSQAPSPKPITAKKPTISEKLPSVETPPILKDASRVPSLHIDIQVHISPQSSDTQIDKVFESMAKHLKDLYNSTK